MKKLVIGFAAIMASTAMATDTYSYTVDVTNHNSESGDLVTLVMNNSAVGAVGLSHTKAFDLTGDANSLRFFVRYGAVRQRFACSVDVFASMQQALKAGAKSFAITVSDKRTAADKRFYGFTYHCDLVVK